MENGQVRLDWSERLRWALRLVNGSVWLHSPVKTPVETTMSVLNAMVAGKAASLEEESRPSRLPLALPRPTPYQKGPWYTFVFVPVTVEPSKEVSSV